MLNRLRNALLRLLEWVAADDDYATCCGCGRNEIDFALVTTNAQGELEPWEQYCRSCWATSPTLDHLNHIEFPETLVKVTWGFADRVGLRIIEQGYVVTP